MQTLHPQGLSGGLPGLASARALRHMSRAAIAHRLGVTETDVLHWETGQATPPILVAIALAQTVGVSVEHLRRAAA